MAHSRIALVANPHAGGGRAHKSISRVKARFESEGVETELWLGANAEQLCTLIRSHRTDSIDAAVALGGDGTVHLLINESVGSSHPIGVIPLGTGNDIAHSWGVPADEGQAVDFVIRGLQRPTKQVDLGQVGYGNHSRYFAAVFSAGFDAIVNERANRMRYPKGASRYTLALLAELGRMKPRRYTLNIAGQSRVVDALLVAVANGPSFGGGMQIVPDAAITDGLLDVFIVHPVSRLEFLKLYPRVFSGTHIGHPAVETLQVESITVDSDTIVGYADGERLGALPAEIRVAPGALRVLSG